MQWVDVRQCTNIGPLAYCVGSFRLDRGEFRLPSQFLSVTVIKMRKIRIKTSLWTARDYDSDNA